MKQIDGPSGSALLDESADRLSSVVSAPLHGAVLTCPAHDNSIRWSGGERFHHVFEQQLDRMELEGTEERVAVSSDEGDVSYVGLERRANRLAHYLIRKGIRPGDKVGILLHRSAWSYAAILAVTKAGAAFVPLDRGFPAERIGFIAEDAGIRLFLTVSDFADQLRALDVPLICLDLEAPVIAGEPSERIRQGDAAGEPDELCYIIYTSGSTGRPKGVAVRHSSICNFIRVAAEVYGFLPADRVYQGMTIAFDFSVEEIWVPLFSGATLVPGPEGVTLVGPDLAAFIVAKRVTALCCVPTLLATIEDDIAGLRFLLVSGEACPSQLVARWHRPGRTFLNVYGPTEATVTATWTHLEPGKPVTIGRPLPTYSIVILDEAELRVVPQGQVGEIGIAGIGLAEGYVNRPDLTDAAFVPDLFGIDRNPSGRIYRTGDLGRIGPDGQVEYLGRKDTQVKIRGYRIELAEIESALLAIQAIAQAVVSVYETSPGVSELVAYYTRRQGAASLTSDAIVDALGRRLPGYMIPAFFEEMTAMPMLPSDKVDRRALPAPMGPRHVSNRSRFAPPANPIEEALADALARTLNLPQISVEDDFFDDLGANSLLMARYCAALRAGSLLPEVSIKDLYLSRTVRTLAASGQRHIIGDGRVEKRPAVHHASRRSYYLCALVQLLFYCIYGVVTFIVIAESLLWIAHASTGIEMVWRSLSAGALLTAGALFLPIVLKWLIVGRWRPRTIPVWSAAYVRFWIVRQLIRYSPLALFAGSPLYNVLLRLLGARIGRHALICCAVPICSDLITVGDGAVVRKSVVLNGYSARSGHIEIGPIEIEPGAFVAEASFVDIDTRIGAGAQLGHASSLQRGQSIPPGRHYHGSPAEPTLADFCKLPPMRCGNLRRAAYTAVQLCMLLIVVPLMLAVFEFLFSAYVFDLESAQAPDFDLHFFVIAVDLALILWLGGLFMGVASACLLPRLLSSFVPTSVALPLFGLRHFLTEYVAAWSNSVYFNLLLGDSSFIVRYLKWVGYRLDPVEQTGSNFGLAQSHDWPFLCEVGTGTLVSDGLSLNNIDMSSSAFMLHPARIGERNYVGSNVLYPHDGKTGANCLLATKVMVPIDGPVRQNTGLLGSPAFEIPRTVLRDRQFSLDVTGALRSERLPKKDAANARTICLFMLSGIFHACLVATLFTVSIAEYLDSGVLAALLALSLPFVSLSYAILLERASIGFGRLSPQSCSIYDEYYWGHERYWKFSVTSRNPIFASLGGTPFRSIVWRLLGVKVGAQLFDDGCWISEKTMVQLGDHCTLAELSTLQGHSLEEGAFKSDYIHVGDDCTIGCNAFVHYGVQIGDGVLLDPDSFLMKGETAPAGSHWRGNPARQLRG